MSIQIQIGADISGVDKAIDQATKSLDKIRPAAANGANSLNALSQVARDAPFGFIAIQNNLPILFDSFGKLTKESGGVTNAFKAIGASLAGPAGVTFALGAAISLFTVLTQKYGSIGGAIDAFLGKTITAKDAQDRFNAALEDSKKASAGEIANLDILVKILTNVNSTRNQQVGAFEELNKKYPALLTNIKLENVRTAESIALIAKRTKLYKDQIILEGRRDALVKLIGESSIESEKALAKLTNAPDVLSLEEFGIALQGVLRGYSPFIARSAVLAENFGNGTKAAKIYAEQLDGVEQSLSAVNGELQTITDNFKKQEQAVKDGIKSDKLYEKTQKGIAAQAEKDRLENLRNTLEAIKRQDFLNKTELETFRKNIQERRKLERESGITTPTQLPTIAPAMPMNVDAMAAQAQAATDALDFLKKEANMTAAYNLMNETFFAPVENLFSNFLQTGKFAFKEFAQSILKAISQIVGKIIATGVVTLLASLFIPGFAAAGGGVGASLLSGITGALGFGGGGFGGAGGSRVGQPNFGGVSGGGMQMAGAVNLTLRGSDLVGSINRTNATINRVG